jgi:NAD(P)-dependent dehydrogenase (short-subunit alcohol dehydrogenase family)
VDLELTGKVVTGGSRGIGEAAARLLVREGCHLALIARNPSVAKTTAGEIDDETSRSVRAYRADTGDDRQVSAAFEDLTGQVGRIDPLVNAAAQPGGNARALNLIEITNEAFWADMIAKVLGYLRCARTAAPSMLKEGWLGSDHQRQRHGGSFDRLDHWQKAQCLRHGDDQEPRRRVRPSRNQCDLRPPRHLSHREDGRSHPALCSSGRGHT